MKSKTWMILASALLCSSALLWTGCAKDTGSKEPSEQAGKPAGKPDGKPDGKMDDGSAGKAELAKINAATNKSTSPNPLAAGKNKDSSYNIKLDAPKTAAQGAETVVRVSVIPTSGWKMNEEFPTRLTVTAPEGVTLAKDQQKLPDAEKFAEKELTFAIKFTPASAGEKSFAADFRFAVCTDATCDPKREKLAWVIDVQ
jgi:hypothetical protein